MAKVKGQEKLNIRNTFESVLILCAKNYQNLSVLVDSTARQSWHFFETQGINISIQILLLMLLLLLFLPLLLVFSLTGLFFQKLQKVKSGPDTAEADLSQACLNQYCQLVYNDHTCLTAIFQD